MIDDTTAAFSFPAVAGKTVTAAFDGGRITSDGGVMLLSLAERRLGIAERLAGFIPDAHDPSRVTHSFADMIRLTYALVDQWMASYAKPPSSVTLDIHDTCDVAHGHQQLSLFKAHYDERCFLPIHVYDTEKSRPVAVILRPGKTPSGVEVRAICGGSILLRMCRRSTSC